MSPIITITINPCIDISAHVPAMIPDRKLHCTHQLKEPGGGGVNISRVIQRFGGNTKAIFTCGGYTGDFFSFLLQKENVSSLPVHIKDHTRENIVVKDEFSGLQYRLGMPGPVITESEWQECLDTLSFIKDPAFIVASGSLTQGVPGDFFARVAEIAHNKNTKFILDTTGEPLRTALEKGVYLIKPNLGELAALRGVKELNKTEAITAAKEFINKKKCEVVVISMGAAGALLVTETITEHIPAPVVRTRSVVGAGDSMLAGIVWRLSNTGNIKDAVRFGVACGAASTLHEGTGLCEQNEAMELFTLMNISY